MPSDTHGTTHTEGPAPKRRRINPNPPVEQDNDDEQAGPACHSCRKKKAKCTRQQPCSHCVHLNVECVYDEKKARPGMRPGAIESLNRRLATLEQMFVGQGLVLKPLLEHALQSPRTSDGNSDASLDVQVERLKNDYVKLAEAVSPADLSDHRHNYAAPSSPILKSASDSRALSSQAVRSLVDWYYDHIHPWIPILHVTLFRQDLYDEGKRPRLKIIIDAIVSLCLRFQPGDFSPARQKEISLNCRHSVILQSMEKFSVESLQALVIIAFDIIGSGRGPSAWSVVGSMTRTVEQLRLSVEEDQGPANGEYLIRRMTFLRKSENWVETEERRRVFWNVFLMDRFCSIATGWNNSLTGADVRRRLPCEGAIWQAGRPVRTPLFGMAGRASVSEQAPTPASERYSTDEDELGSIGGFAFCIEATENLNLVTSFFLHHPVAFNDVQEMQVWLMRFKELDLRLVKWRLFLPAQWRNASVLNQDGIMDPNLTLAHITHNTAVIQLHQCIAYPAPQWRACSISLPSASSSETCITAAAEISTIADQYLRQSTGITNPQFSFCLFIAGRVLLAHSTYTSAPLHPAFEVISTSLAEIGRRWIGQGSESPESNENLALRFHKRLVQAQRAVVGTERLASHDLTLDIRQPVYSDSLARSRAPSATPRPEGVHDNPVNGTAVYNDGTSPDSISLAFPPLPMAFDQGGDLVNAEMPAALDFSNGQHELNMLFDDQYQQMLRVSTFVDSNSHLVDPLNDNNRNV